MSHSAQNEQSAQEPEQFARVTHTRVNAMQLVKNIQRDGLGMVNDLKAMGIAETKPIAKAAGVGGGMFGAAGYLALNAVSLLFLAGAFAFTMIFTKGVGWSVVPSLALGFVCMAVLLLLITGILALLGKKQIDKVGPPQQTINEAKQSIETLKTSVQRGKDTVTANQLARADLAELKKESKDVQVSSL